MQPTAEYLRASNGTANPSLMTIQAVRAVGVTTATVNTTAGAPDKFFASMGTPHTFIDPVTNENITVISEETAVDFAGHLDNGKVEIDWIAPGYEDLGSAVGDIIVIRPTAQWADVVAATAEKMDDFVEENGDWRRLLETFTVSAGGANREATVAVSASIAAKVGLGSKLRLTRGGSFPTKSAAFVGTSSQYASIAAPTINLSTTTFTIADWIYIDDYPFGSNIRRTVAARFNNGTGWFLEVDAAGLLRGYAAGTGGVDEIITYRTVDRKRWVHVAWAVDMAGAHVLYIDGESVDYHVQTGTATAVTQAGAISMGARLDATNGYFDGCMSDFRIYNSKLTAAEVQMAMLGFPAANTGMALWYKFDGNWNDSVGNNNLTASGGAVATNTKVPYKEHEFVRVTKIDGLNLTLFSGTASVIPNIISSVDYSTVAVPYGFPAADNDWTLEFLYLGGVGNFNATGLVQGEFKAINGLRVNLPAGKWKASWAGVWTLDLGASAEGTFYMQLSPHALTTFADRMNNRLYGTQAYYRDTNANNGYKVAKMAGDADYENTALTEIRLYGMRSSAAGHTIYKEGANPTVVRFECAYK